MGRTFSFGIGALALVGMALPASAADMPVKAPPAAPAAPVAYNWSSCYLGVNGGGKWSDFHTDHFVGTGALGLGPLFFPFDGNNGSSNTSGMFGGQVGCQWQSGGWVFGFEGDFDGTNLRRTFVAGALAPFPFLPGDALEFKNDWQASIRGRLGYAWDRWLVYGTGGVAFANIEATLALVPAPFALPTFVGSRSDTATGWTIGAGVEYAFWNNLSIGLEYRFTQFGRQDFSLAGGTLLAFPVLVNPRLDTNEVTARLNWHFNLFGGGPY